MEEVCNIETEEDFVNVIEELLNNLYQNNIQSETKKLLSESVIEQAKTEIKDVIFKTTCVARTVYELLLSKGFIKERSKIISTLIESKRSDLLYATLYNYNSAYGEMVTEYDWAVKLVHGTSELKKLKYPLLQLKLTTFNNGQKQQRMYDVNKDMLGNLIQVLENIDTQS